MMPDPSKRDSPPVLGVRKDQDEPPAWQLERHMEHAKAIYYIRLHYKGRAYVLTKDFTLQPWDKLVRYYEAHSTVGKFALYDCSDNVEWAEDAARLRFSAKIALTATDVEENSNSKRLLWTFRGVNMAPVVGSSSR